MALHSEIELTTPPGGQRPLPIIKRAGGDEPELDSSEPPDEPELKLPDEPEPDIVVRLALQY